MIGSPSAETGMAPLMIVWMPRSLRIGRRSAAGRANSSSRSMSGGNSERAKTNDVRFQVEILVGVAERGEAGIECQLPLGDEILVLDDAGGECNAHHLGDAFRPDAGAVDEDLAADGAV